MDNTRLLELKSSYRLAQAVRGAAAFTSNFRELRAKLHKMLDREIDALKEEILAAKDAPAAIPEAAE